VDQGASLVDKALESGELFELDGWKHIAPAATSGTLHLIGLLSDGGVHSRYDQLKLLFDGVPPCAQTFLCTMQLLSSLKAESIACAFITQLCLGGRKKIRHCLWVLHFCSDKRWLPAK
jgi:hypothetical protein